MATHATNMPDASNFDYYNMIHLPGSTCVLICLSVVIY